MFGSTLLHRRGTPERIADQAWRYLTSTVDSAGESVRDTTRPALPWALLVGAALAGAAIGWAAGSAARAVGRRGDRTIDEIEFVDVDRPNSPADQG